jgi:ADP-ribose pyrophosphatase YjhB (NUDIX family)
MHAKKVESRMRLQFAQKAAIISDGRILLVRKSSDDPENPGLWELPGGRLKEVETLDDSLAREVHEETGVMVQPGRPIDVWDWTMRLGQEEVRVVAVSRLCSYEGESATHVREADDYIDDQAWIKVSSLGQLNVIASQKPTIDQIVASA